VSNNVLLLQTKVAPSQIASTFLVVVVFNGLLLVILLLLVLSTVLVLLLLLNALVRLHHAVGSHGKRRCYFAVICNVLSDFLLYLYIYLYIYSSDTLCVVVSCLVSLWCT